MLKGLRRLAGGFCSQAQKLVRNIAIIAHVDHGKTTLVDSLLKNSGNEISQDCVMDSNQLEKEKGITILAKATAVFFNNHKINIVDTPGHHDFGGEVERIMNMVDGVCLLVCATEGPMTQTRFVLKKALMHGIKPLVVINKVDRPTARIKEVQNQIFSLFCDLNCPEDLLNYPIFYSSGKNGWAIRNLDESKVDCKPILQGIIQHVPPPKVPPQPKTFSMLVSQTEPNNFHGKCLIGRINTGVVRVGDKLEAFNQDKMSIDSGKVTKLIKKVGLGSVLLEEAHAGDIVGIAGLPGAGVTDIICTEGAPYHLPATKIDPPLMGITVSVNTSPLAGKDGTKISFNELKKRLQWQAENDVALKVEIKSTNIQVKGRGDLHLGILIQKIRREGFEMTVTPPEIVFQTIKGKQYEPTERVELQIPHELAGSMMERMNNRKGTFVERSQVDNLTKMVFIVPSRGLIGLRSELLNETKGTAVVKTSFHEYVEDVGPIVRNSKGAIISMNQGVCTTYGLRDVEKHGALFVRPNSRIYPGMVIGECTKDNDVDVNPTKQKKLTNIRTHSHDEKIVLVPVRYFSIEEAICYVRANELIQVTPKEIRIRKKVLDKTARDKERRDQKKAY